VTHGHCDVCTVTFPSAGHHRPLTLTCQIILLDDSGTSMRTTCPMLLPESAVCACVRACVCVVMIYQAMLTLYPVVILGQRNRSRFIERCKFRFRFRLVRCLMLSSAILHQFRPEFDKLIVLCYRQHCAKRKLRYFVLSGEAILRFSLRGGQQAAPIGAKFGLKEWTPHPRPMSPPSVKG